MKDVCPNCHAGALRLQPVTYAAWHIPEGSGQEQFVVVLHIPAWLCDVCGTKFFNVEASGRLASLLGPTAKPDENAHWSFLRSEREWPSFDGDLDRGRAQ